MKIMRLFSTSPNSKLDIVHLNHSNSKFKEKALRYHQLDYDIRQLEIASRPCQSVEKDIKHPVQINIFLVKVKGFCSSYTPIFIHK